MWLWLKKYKPDLLPEDTPELKRRFEMGREVDLLSRQLFHGGIEAEGFNYDGWRNTKSHIDNGAKIIFQPTAMAGALTCRADILTKTRSGGWDLNEVKMTTQVKEEHYYDAGFQRLCFERAGIKIDRVNLVHINNKYIRKGEIKPEKLFVSEDITDEIRAKTPEVQELIGKVFAMLKRKDAPDAELLQSCPNPEKCKYAGYYRDGFPELRKKSEVEFSKIDAPAIRKELECLKYPLYFFDYETYMSAIPPFDGTRPYQQIPFQYSLMVKDGPKAKVRHSEFLAREFKNPAPDLLAQLKREVGPKGSVIVWFASFEMGCNDEMARMEPKYADFLKAMNSRIFDLMLIFKFKRQMYVKSEFQQSASLKKVLPVMCPELSYESLTIQEGGTAAASWPILTGRTLAEKEKAQLAENMLTYCKRDTEAMVGILEKLEKEIKK